jgi:hypothetical protein
MDGRSRSRSALLGLAAGLATLLATAEAPAQPSVCTDSEGARIFAQNDSALLDMECGSLKEAQKACKNWLSLCKRDVVGAFKCKIGELKAKTRFDKTACSVKTGQDKKDCLSMLKSAVKNEKSILKTAKKTEAPKCQDHVPTCIGQCFP